MTDNRQSAPRRRKRSRRRERIASIRIRVLAIALIPSVALLVTGGSVAGYLISEGLSEHSFAGYFAGNVGAGPGLAGVVDDAAAAVRDDRAWRLPPPSPGVLNGRRGRLSRV